MADVDVGWRPPVHVNTHERVSRFMDCEVTEFDPGVDPEAPKSRFSIFRSRTPAAPKRPPSLLRELDKRAFRVGINYDDGPQAFAARLDALLADPHVAELRGLLIGCWFSGACEAPPTELVSRLLKRGHELRSLEGLFVGDIPYEECEISWLLQTDYAQVLRALPQLREFWVRGGNGLRFANLEHASLRALTVQTGGLSRETVQDIAAARLPQLRTLTLWFGSDNYGADSEVSDLAPILSGEAFPQLEHLGLQNSEDADAIAAAVATSPILGRLKGLDLSMGTLTDEGARALLAAPALRGLRHLNLRFHYLSTEMEEELKALNIDVNVSEPQEADEDYRYAEVTE